MTSGYSTPSFDWAHDFIRDHFRGVEAITDAQTGVALNYLEDSSIEAACLPIKAVLHNMAYGNYKGVLENDAWLIKISDSPRQLG